jgi:hypothetical protein
MAGKFAVPAYNFNNMEQLQAIALGCVAESDSPFILQVSSGARKYADQTLLRYMAQGAVEMIKATGTQAQVHLASRPRRHLRAVQVVHRDRLLVGHDRRLAPSVREEHRRDPQGRRVRPQIRRYRRGRAGRAGRHRRRRGGRQVGLHAPRSGGRLREEDRRGFAGHLHRHLARRLQVQARAVHAQQGRRARAPAPPLRHSRRDREAHPRLPHRAPRRLVGGAQVRRHDQPVRRQARQRRRHPRGPAAQAPPPPRCARSTSTPTAAWP